MTSRERRAAKRKKVLKKCVGWDLLRKIVPESKRGSLRRKGASQLEGEASLISLQRFGNDRSLRGRIWNSCCNCNMEHLYIFEVFPDPTRPDIWWLNKRPYGNPDKPGKPVIARKLRGASK